MTWARFCDVGTLYAKALSMHFTRNELLFLNLNAFAKFSYKHPRRVAVVPPSHLSREEQPPSPRLSSHSCVASCAFAIFLRKEEPFVSCRTCIAKFPRSAVSKPSHCPRARGFEPATALTVENDYRSTPHRKHDVFCVWLRYVGTQTRLCPNAMSICTFYVVCLVLVVFHVQ